MRIIRKGISNWKERERKKIIGKKKCPVIHPKLLSAAKKTDDKVCLWCGGKLTNDNESFCSVYCANLWGGEGD